MISYSMKDTAYFAVVDENIVLVTLYTYRSLMAARILCNILGETA